ncbi:hypothetical protein OG21DRAFT_1130033 [Imleria badia]|nr:hypothetical protein OG21DRAFT_1130033 [Imleria badia]
MRRRGRMATDVASWVSECGNHGTHQPVLGGGASGFLGQTPIEIAPRENVWGDLVVRKAVYSRTFSTRGVPSARVSRICDSLITVPSDSAWCKTHTIVARPRCGNTRTMRKQCPAVANDRNSAINSHLQRTVNRFSCPFGDNVTIAMTHLLSLGGVYHVHASCRQPSPLWVVLTRHFGNEPTSQEVR